jgi:hypothetical protein
MQSPVPKILFTVLSILFATAAQAQQPDPTQPPPSEHPILTLHATGSQIYTCKQADRSYAWTFVAPAARLFDNTGNEVATHGDGPIWNYQDGSSIQGVVQAKSTPDSASIPWLLLKSTNPQRTGILTTVDFIRRSDTHGGIAPTTGCDADHQGALARVPYTAIYTFYSAKP